MEIIKDREYLMRIGSGSGGVKLDREFYAVDVKERSVNGDGVGVFKVEDDEVYFWGLLADRLEEKECDFVVETDGEWCWIVDKSGARLGFEEVNILVADLQCKRC